MQNILVHFSYDMIFGEKGTNLWKFILLTAHPQWVQLTKKKSYSLRNISKTLPLYLFYVYSCCTFQYRYLYHDEEVSEITSSVDHHHLRMVLYAVTSTLLLISGIFYIHTLFTFHLSKLTLSVPVNIDSHNTQQSVFHTDSYWKSRLIFQYKLTKTMSFSINKCIVFARLR